MKTAVQSVAVTRYISLKCLKNHLRLIHGSTILDYIGTCFLEGRLICGSDLYASIYGKFIPSNSNSVLHSCISISVYTQHVT